MSDVALFGKSTNQISYSYNSVRGWDITIRFGKKLTSAILEFYFRYRFRLYHRSRHVILQHTLCQISSTSDRPPQKNDMSTLKMADLRHLEFRDPITGSLQWWVRGQHVRGQGQYLRGQGQWSWLLKKNIKKMTFLIKIHSSINCLVIFLENRVLVYAFWRQTNRLTAPMR